MSHIVLMFIAGCFLGVPIRVAYVLSATLRSDISAASRAAVREFRNRRWYRRVRANIHTEF